jgi:hypothetical protein
MPGGNRPLQRPVLLSASSDSTFRTLCSSVLTLIHQRSHNLNRARASACPDADQRFVPPDKLSDGLISIARRHCWIAEMRHAANIAGSCKSPHAGR